MYIPKIAENLKDKKFVQLRLGLQGEPGSGKTTSALTFPNPIILDCDNGLTNFLGLDIPIIPIWDATWLDENYHLKPLDRGAMQPNRKEAILRFLREDGMKLTNEQTLIIDSWTALQTFFDQQEEAVPQITGGGKINEFTFWANKIEFSERVMTYVCSLKCNVVICYHEYKVRDPKTNQLLEKSAPLMQGKFVAQIKRWHTDFYRCIVEEEKNKEGKVFKSNYWWQVRSDNQFDSKCSLKNLSQEVFKVEPDYNKTFAIYGFGKSSPTN